MQQTKISFNNDHINFLNKYQELGFKDKSSLVRSAMDEFMKLIEKRKLVNSARLYSEIYRGDEEMRDLTDSAIQDWPE